MYDSDLGSTSAFPEILVVFFLSKYIFSIERVGLPLLEMRSKSYLQQTRIVSQVACCGNRDVIVLIAFSEEWKGPSTGLEV